MTLKQKNNDRALNYWRTFSDAGKHFLPTIKSMLATAEGRQRQRKPHDQQRYDQLVEAIIADLAYNHLLQEPLALHVSRKNLKKFQRQYQPEFLTQMLSNTLDGLSRVGLIEQQKGHRGSHREGQHYAETRITASPLLVSLLTHRRITIDLISTNYTGQEIVVLKGEKDDYFTNADLMDYEDTSDTIKYRNEVRTINTWLKLVPVGVHEHMNITSHTPVDLRERHMRRYFTRNSFTSGGRLFGGFWQPLTKHDRLVRLHMRGQETVEKDYSSMVPRLLYSVAGQMIPYNLTGDLYHIPGFEGSRAGIKKLFSAMLFDWPTTTRKRFPGDACGLFNAAELAKVGGKVGPVMDAIKKAHEPVAELFSTGIGHRLFFLESQIMVAILLELGQREAYGLPIHDAILTSQQDAQVVEKVMYEVFERMTGKPGKITTLTHRHLLAA